jgi:hypothetical protein
MIHGPTYILDKEECCLLQQIFSVDLPQNATAEVVLNELRMMWTVMYNRLEQDDATGQWRLHPTGLFSRLALGSEGVVVLDPHRDLSLFRKTAMSIVKSECCSRQCTLM